MLVESKAEFWNRRMVIGSEGRHTWDIVATLADDRQECLRIKADSVDGLTIKAAEVRPDIQSVRILQATRKAFVGLVIYFR